MRVKLKLTVDVRAIVAEELLSFGRPADQYTIVIATCQWCNKTSDSG